MESEGNEFSPSGFMKNNNGNGFGVSGWGWR